MKTKDIIGKKVISVREGDKLGAVRCPVIDGAHQKVIGFVVDDREWFLETKIVLFQSIRGMEDEVITVDDKTAVTPVRDLKKMHPYLEENIQVINMKVISESGKFLGRVEDFSFQVTTGKIESYHVKQSPLSLDGRDVLSMGQDMIIVKEECMVGMPADEPDSLSGVDLSSLFEKRQIEFLLGKVLVRDIYDGQGGMLASAGSIVDSGSIMRIKRAGKFTELLMSVESEE